MNRWQDRRDLQRHICQAERDVNGEEKDNTITYQWWNVGCGVGSVGVVVVGVVCVGRGVAGVCGGM